jgi:hypothetical protein
MWPFPGSVRVCYRPGTGVQLSPRRTQKGRTSVKTQSKHVLYTKKTINHAPPTSGARQVLPYADARKSRIRHDACESSASWDDRTGGHHESNKYWHSGSKVYNEAVLAARRSTSARRETNRWEKIPLGDKTVVSHRHCRVSSARFHRKDVCGCHFPSEI